MASPDRRGRPLPVPAGRPGMNLESPQAAQVVAAAGTAIVGAAKMGRLLTRTGWGLARRLPGGVALQREVQRLQDAALTEVRRILDVPDGVHARSATPEEQRAVLLIGSSNGVDPLRSAMGELLDRSVEPDRKASRDYLFGNIISQLVPDEARILAALSDGTSFAAGDVLARRRGRGSGRVVLSNVSVVGRHAGVVSPDNVPTYLSRLLSFGLIEFAAPDESLSVQYDILETDSTVQGAYDTITAQRLGTPRLVRKTLTISALGREFWSATDPARSALPPA